MLLSDEPRKQRQSILRRIEEKGLSDHVIVLPSRPGAELPSYLLAADCIVVPSLSEGFGYSAIEAATIGCHVIAVRGHAVEEVLGNRGTFVPSPDPAALANAIVTTPRAGVEGDPLPPRFTLQAHVDALESVYDRLIEPIWR